MSEPTDLCYDVTLFATVCINCFRMKATNALLAAGQAEDMLEDKIKRGEYGIVPGPITCEVDLVDEETGETLLARDITQRKGTIEKIEKAAALVDVAELLAACKAAERGCPCTIMERNSGHRVDCYVPELQAAIAKAERRAFDTLRA